MEGDLKREENAGQLAQERTQFSGINPFRFGRDSLVALIPRRSFDPRGPPINLFGCPIHPDPKGAVLQFCRGDHHDAVSSFDNIVFKLFHVRISRFRYELG